MVDLKKRAELDARVKAELLAMPEANEINLLVQGIKINRNAIMELKKESAILYEKMTAFDENIESAEKELKTLLLKVEEQSGYTKMPLPDGTVYLSEIKGCYEIANTDAVPKDYIITEMTSRIDKKKLKSAIEEGKLTESNWLKLLPSYKTVVIK